MNVTLKGFDSLSAKLKGLSSGVTERMMPVCKQLSEDITADAKGLVYQDNLKYQDGAIRDSLHPYAQQEDGEIKFGVRTENEIAIYHEMGTGPVGTAAGYPGEGESDVPVARRSTGWTYWSDQVAAQRAAESGDGTEANGFVYTEGVPPKAFMYNAVLQNKEDAQKALADAIREELKK